MRHRTPNRSHDDHHRTQPDLSIVSGDFWGRNPHDELRWLREHDPVYWDGGGRLGRSPGTTTSRRSKSDPATFSNAGGIRPDTGPIPMMIDMDDPEHLRRRKLVNKGFTPRRVREQRGRGPRASCDEIIDAVCEQGECDFVWDIAAWLPLIMIGDDLGVAPEDRADAARWSDDHAARRSTGDPELLERGRRRLHRVHGVRHRRHRRPRGPTRATTS